MPSIKLKAFGGMLPAADSRLLPDNMAADAENVWLYTGTLEGIREPKPVYTVVDPLTKRAFRIPKGFVDEAHIQDSYWLEFPHKDVDVLGAPMANDGFDRYYWAGDPDGSAYFPPRYNTFARIAQGDPGFVLGIPAPSRAPVVSAAPGKFALLARTGLFTVLGGTADLYHTTQFAYDANTVANGLPPPEPPNFTLKVTGSKAVLKHVTNDNSQRVTIADDGTITYGVPVRTPDEIEPPDEILTSRAYVYTWVSAYGEEGPPSPPTVFNGYAGEPWYVRLTAPTNNDLDERNLSKVRIYRTVTSSVGVATYFFVAELDVGQVNYTDTQTDAQVSSNNQLESTNWTAPPADLVGMASMPNGIFVGFRQNEIWFSEPYHPHAWPSIYTLSVDFKIIGLGVIGQTVVVCTEAATYAATGVNPSVMTLAMASNDEPCVSRGSIVSTEYGVAYASPNGLVVAAAGRVTNATEKLFTKDKWKDAFNLPVLRGSTLGSSYYAFGSIDFGCFQGTAFENTAFELTNFTGARSGGIIDTDDQRMAFVRLASDEPTMDVYNDPWTNEVFVLREGVVYQIDISSNQPRSEYTWRSKKFQTDSMRNFEAMKVFFDNPEGLTDKGTIKFYADDRLVITRPLTTSGMQMRLPSGFKANFWQVEVTSRVVISSIQWASTAKELLNV